MHMAALLSLEPLVTEAFQKFWTLIFLSDSLQLMEKCQGFNEKKTNNLFHSNCSFWRHQCRKRKLDSCGLFIFERSRRAILVLRCLSGTVHPKHEHLHSDHKGQREIHSSVDHLKTNKQTKQLIFQCHFVFQQQSCFAT